MAESFQFKHPWFVAVWPGMGQVALNAGIYLLAKLDMKLFAEFEANALFDVDFVEVKLGLIEPVRRPTNRCFFWRDPKEKHDLVVFVGEAQPPIGKYPFCRELIAFIQKLHVERVFTFAAMATQMRPEDPSRVFAAATDKESLEELKRLELEPLEDGNVGGLNGVLLGASAEAGLRGACMLGEMPLLFRQLPFPKASLAILESFATLAGLDLDLSQLAEQARSTERQLSEFLARAEQSMRGEAGEETEFQPEPSPDDEEAAANRKRIEALFQEAAKDRSRAFELKQELDRLGLFKEYEDQFLDLFKSSSK
jgi:uncharacterized protein